MNYNEAMDYIKNTFKFGSNLGLERTNKILELLGNPHKKIKCIHIAGTNGKGSISVMLARTLKEAGYKVGMYTSPYLEEFEERIQINGENISKKDLSEIVTEVSTAVDKVLELGYDHPTEFEIITCSMFLYFFKSNVDFAVIEVGLGGRLDSTNVLLPFNKENNGGVILSIISSISYDHMNVLGNTLEKIAYEKAGIIKEKVPVISYPQKKNVLDVIEKVCKERESSFIKVPLDCAQYIGTANLYKEKRVQKLKIETKNNKYKINLSLLGKHQILNCSVVIFAIEELIKQGVQINKEHIINALSRVEWKGRLEIIKKNPMVIIDGAHNIDGIKSLKENIKCYFKYNKIILILGILADKQVEEMVSTIAPIVERVIAVTPNNYRGESTNDLIKIIKKYNVNCEAIENYEEAYSKGVSYCNSQDLLLISGSLYMIGDMRKIIKRQMI